MEKTLFGFVSYKILNYVLEKYTTKKLAMNYTAMTHATSASIVWLFGTPNIMICNSGGYFLFDIYYLFKNRELNFTHSLHRMVGRFGNHSGTRFLKCRASV